MRKKWLIAGVVVAVLLAWLLFFRGAYTPTPPSFAGSSKDLKQTIVVATLDAPIPEGKSAIWSAAFPLAWRELEKLAGGPVQLDSGQKYADAMNRAAGEAPNLPAEMVLAVAGRTRDGVAERIQRGLADKFPHATPPPINTESEAVAFAHLHARVRFPTPYFERQHGVKFTDAQGNISHVGGFGFGDGRATSETLKVQARTLFIKLNSNERLEQFAVNLCQSCEPVQIVMAKIPRPDSLESAIADVERKAGEKSDLPLRFGIYDSLFVPNIHFRISHSFSDLEGSDKIFKNEPLAGLFLGSARQDMHFHLDRSGVELSVSSDSRLFKSEVKEVHFDRPFLLYMKVRDSGKPFFAMWIDNAELLRPHGGRQDEEAED